MHNGLVSTGNLSHPPLTLSGMGNHLTWCDHRPVWVGRVAVSSCAECGRVEWFSDVGAIDLEHRGAAHMALQALQGLRDARRGQEVGVHEGAAVSMRLARPDVSAPG